MKRLLPLAAALIPGLSWGQNVLKLWERSVALDATAVQAEFLTNGSFAVLVGGATTSRIYISTRTNSVTSVTPLNAKITKIVSDSFGIYAIGSVNSNSFFARIDFDGTLLWSRVMDASSLGREDAPNDVIAAVDGRLYIGGTIVGETHSYGYVVGLVSGSGLISFRATNASVGGVRALGFTNNSQIHAASLNQYWRLNNAGATQQVSNFGTPIEIRDLEAKGDKVYAVGRQTVGNQVSPYLQVRSQTGVFIGEGRDRFTLNDNLGFDVYNRVLIDSTGRAVSAGLVTDENRRYTRLARWTPTPVLLSSAYTNLSGAVLRDGPIALDRHDHMYWVSMFDRTTNSSSSISMVKYNGGFSPIFSTLIRETTNVDAGGSEGIAVDGNSGDLVIPYRDVGGPVKWQLWRQRPVANGDGYAVPSTSSYVSSHPVTANDLFFSECVIEIVTYPTKGSLVMTSTGTFLYGRFLGQMGQDSFVYRLRKNGMPGAIATVILQLI